MILKLPPIRTDWHKYERGFLVGFGGSNVFKGAIKLSARAALTAGAGIVRIFSLDDIGQVPDEIISQIWDKEDWSAVSQKASAFMIGPGLGREKKVKKWLDTYLHQIEKPIVIDADALYFFPFLKHLPKQIILTPHRGEMIHLLGGKSDSLIQRCDAFSKQNKVVLLLKGMPTHVFSPEQDPILIERGDPAMATAGSGDVLTGIIGALLSQKTSLLDAAVLGAHLHALAGESAARKKTSYCVTASDLIQFLPDSFNSVLNLK